MKKNLVLLVIVLTFFCFTPAFAQDRTPRLFTNGVTVSLVNNGMALRLENENSLSLANANTRYAVDVVVYYADGTSELKSYGVTHDRTTNYDSRGNRTLDGIKRGDFILDLPKRATAISLPTVAQTAQLGAERERRQATERAERERREAAERAERERRETEERTARENAERIRREAPAFLESGTAAFQRGDYDRAIADFTRSIQGDPQATAYNNRGAAYNGKGDWDRAIADFNEAIRIDPNYAAPYRHRAFAYMQKGNSTQARTDVNRALQINPNYQSARELSAELQRRGY